MTNDGRRTTNDGARRRSGGPLALAVLALLLGRAVSAAPIAVEATVDRNQVAVGEAVVLTIAISGAQNVAVPELGEVKGFRADYLGPSTQFSIINGQMSSSVSHRYRLVALQPGQFSLGPFTVEYQGQRYQSAAVPMRVAAAPGGRGRAAAGAPQAVKLVVRPAKTEVYAGEPIALTVVLYVGNARVDDLQYPRLSGEGVVFDKLSEPVQRDEVLDGQRYRALRFETKITPLRPGPVDLEATMAMSMIVSRRGGRGDPFFDPFFDAFGERRPTEVRAEPVQLTVLPLPEAGRPADFSGAVGQFDFTLTAQPTSVDAGDPVTVRMEIRGSGNLGSVVAPAVPVSDRFRSYEVQPVKDEDRPDRRVFEQVVIPKVAGAAELPAVRFSFFDPAAAAYRTITRGPVPLTVLAKAEAERPAVLAGAQPAVPAGEAPALGRDIVYIKDAPGAWRARGERFAHRAWFAIAQVVPPLLFAAVFAYVRRRDRLAADPRLARFRQAGREARRALAALDGTAPGVGRFYDQLSAALAAYLSAKLDLPPGAVERERVLARLPDGASPELRRDVAAFFDLVEQARYAAGREGGTEPRAALDLARAIVARMERERRAERGAVAAGVALVLLLGTALPSPGVEAGAQAAFYQGNQAYAAGRYADAVAAYESALATGRESGALHFNLGNALVKSGQVAPAIVAYERALRLVPRDPDVRANLAYARELAAVKTEARPLWKRMLFPLAPRATSGELAAVASALWWAFWMVLTLRLLVPRARLGLGRAAWAAAACYLATAGSLGMRLAETDLREVAIVTAPGETPVRFEPSATGTEHYLARAGSALDVTDERESWLQVRRADGRRGWIPRDAVERLDAPAR